MDSKTLIELSKKLLQVKAKNKVIVYEEFEENTINYQKGSNLPVGGMTEYKRSYVNHTIPIKKETNFYLFSDGYADQFGGDFDKKFMITNFRKLLFNNHKASMIEQRNVLDQNLKAWKRSTPQTDDILVIGMTVKPN